MTDGCDGRTAFPIRSRCTENAASRTEQVIAADAATAESCQAKGRPRQDAERAGEETRRRP